MTTTRTLPRLVPLQSPDQSNIPREHLEKLQADSHASFAWRALEALRKAWGEALPGGRVELVLEERDRGMGYLLGRPHIECMPFPWHPAKTAFWFFGPASPRPIRVFEPRAQDALGPDGVSVSPTWVMEGVRLALEGLSRGGSPSGPGPAPPPS